MKKKNVQLLLAGFLSLTVAVGTIASPISVDAAKRETAKAVGSLPITSGLPSYQDYSDKSGDAAISTPDEGKLRTDDDITTDNSQGAIRKKISRGINTYADTAPVLYDASQMGTYKSRTIQQVADKYAAARNCSEVYNDADSSTWYKIPASTKAPYAYGELSAETHKAMTAMTNFYRWLAGVDELRSGSSHSASLQAQALDRNFEFNHYISNDSKPEDMDAGLWNEGYACTHNILARFYTPRVAITGWMNEGYSLRTKEFDTVGHRMALIGSSLSQIDFGYAGSIAIGVENEYENTMKEAFAAFPAPGYMPNNLCYPSSSAWSVELNTSMVKVSNPSAVTIKVTNTNTGKSYLCTEAAGNAEVGSMLIFAQPDDASSDYYTDSYEVDITGLTDVATGGTAQIKYIVKFVDIKQYASTYVTKAAADIKNYVIHQSAATNEYLKKVAAILPTEVTVKGESGFTASVPVKGQWKVNMAKKCFENSVDASKLPSNLIDKKGILNLVSIPYAVSESFYDAYNSLSIDPTDAMAGDSVKFYVYRTLASTDTSRIYKITKCSDGTYSAVKTLDSASSAEFNAAKSEASSPYHIYEKKVTGKDSGEYISVYYDSEDVNWGGISYYVSVGTEILTVKNAADEGLSEGTVNKAGKKIRITFHPNKGTISKKTKNRQSGHKVGTLPTAKRKGYTFTGWYTHKTKGKKVTTNTKLKKNTVLYAHWLKGSVPKAAISKLTAGKQKLTVKVKKAKNAKGYQIRYSLKANMKDSQTVYVKGTSVTLKKLKKGKKYYIQVRAYRRDTSGDKVYGKWSGKKNKKVK